MFKFTKEQVLSRTMVREFAEAELVDRTLELDKKGEFPRDIVEKLGKLGIIGITAPTEYGGTAAGQLAGVIAVEELACVCPSIALFMEVTQTPMYALDNYGSQEQKKKYLSPVIKGEKIICVAATEPTGGSAMASLGTEAVADDENYIVNGKKFFITNGGVADFCAVLAKTGDRASILIVERGMEGFVVDGRHVLTGFKAGDVSNLSFNNCRLPKENLIGKEGAGLALAVSIFTANRPAVGAVGLGIARGAFEIALKYAKERVLYGSAISNLQAIRFMLVDMDTEIESAKWLIYYPAAALDSGLTPQAISKYSARAKVIGAEAAFSVTHKAMQILGGCGVSPEYRLAGLINDAMVLFPATGTSQIMKVIQANEII